jgi:hypothetical protein
MKMRSWKAISSFQPTSSSKPAACCTEKPRLHDQGFSVLVFFRFLQPFPRPPGSLIAYVDGAAACFFRQLFKRTPDKKRTGTMIIFAPDFMYDVVGTNDLISRLPVARG